MISKLDKTTIDGKIFLGSKYAFWFLRSIPENSNDLITGIEPRKDSSCYGPYPFWIRAEQFYTNICLVI